MRSLVDLFFGILSFIAVAGYPQYSVAHSWLEEHPLRALDAVVYRKYQSGDDMSLVDKQWSFDCAHHLCWTAVVTGTQTVVAAAEMTIPADHISDAVKKAIEAKMPEPSKKKVDKQIGMLDYITVAEAWQKQGIATKLLSETFHYLGATQPKLVAMYLVVKRTNYPAIALYKKSGLEEVLDPPRGSVVFYARYDIS